MKISIRPKTFETNSSSMHSICVAWSKDRPDYELKETRMNMIAPYAKPTESSYGYQGFRIDLVETMSTHKYGWGLEILNSFIDKLGYVYSSFYAEDRTYEKRELIEDAIGIDQFEGFIIPDPPNFVDHQSIGLIEQYLENSEDPVKALRELLFNDRLFILVSNDNDGWFCYGNESQEEFITQLCGSWGEILH